MNYLDEIENVDYVKQKIENIKLRIEKTSKLYVDGLIDNNFLEEQLKYDKNRIKRLNERLVIPDRETALKRLETFKDANYNNLSQIEKRECWKNIIDEMRLYADRSIEIDFRR